MSAKFGLKGSSPSAKDWPTVQQAQLDHTLVPGATFLNKTLYSKPTTADSMAAGRRQGDREKAAKTTSISNESTTKKRFRMASGRSGVIVGGA